MEKMKKNNIKKIAGVLTATLMLSVLSACGNTSDKTDIAAKDYAKNLNMTSVGTSEDDSQSYWGATSHNIARGEAGYYYMNLNYIMYFDEETKTSFPLCGKAECSHKDENCNAFLSVGKYILHTIYYYRNYLYIQAHHNGAIYLERVNADGSGRLEICQLAVSEDESTTKLVFHDDSVYVFESGHCNSNTENTEVVKKISLDGNTNEKIFEYTATNARITLGRSYGDKLFFIVEAVKIDENKEMRIESMGLFSYDYTTGESGKVIDDNVSDYSIDSQKISYIIL